jgi:hypothetical protein
MNSTKVTKGNGAAFGYDIRLMTVFQVPHLWYYWRYRPNAERDGA